MIMNSYEYENARKGFIIKNYGQRSTQKGLLPILLLIKQKQINGSETGEYRINSTGHFYDADVTELKERMADVWELLKTRQREEL